jgi:hypothetical protein
LITGIAFSVNAAKFLPPKVVDNTDYPNIVANVKGHEISGNEFTNNIELEKSKWERFGKPQTKSFYETTVLKRMVLNILMDADAKQKGLTVTNQDASEYLTDTVKKLNSLSNDDPARNQFLNEIAAYGHTDINEYTKDPNVLNATKDLLLRAKLKRYIYNTVSTPSDEEVDTYIKSKNIRLAEPDHKEGIKQLLLQEKRTNAWKNYVNQLLNEKDYQLFVPIDIKAAVETQ